MTVHARSYRFSDARELSLVIGCIKGRTRPCLLLVRESNGEQEVVEIGRFMGDEEFDAFAVFLDGMTGQLQNVIEKYNAKLRELNVRDKDDH